MKIKIFKQTALGAEGNFSTYALIVDGVPISSFNNEKEVQEFIKEKYLKHKN